MATLTEQLAETPGVAGVQSYWTTPDPALRGADDRSADVTVLPIVMNTREQITADIAERWPGIHLTTVYRTLETLAEVGVVTHVHLASGTAYHLADTAGGMPAHVHAQCRTCHRVIDLPDDVLDDVFLRFLFDLF